MGSCLSSTNRSTDGQEMAHDRASTAKVHPEAPTADHPEILLSAPAADISEDERDEMTLVGGQSTRRPSHASATASVVGAGGGSRRLSFTRHGLQWQPASRGETRETRGASASTALNGRSIAGVSRSNSKGSLADGNTAHHGVGEDGVGDGIRGAKHLLSKGASRRSSGLQSQSNIITANMMTTSNYSQSSLLSAADVMKGLGWGKNDSINGLVDSKAENMGTSKHSLKALNTTEFLSPAGSVDVINGTGLNMAGIMTVKQLMGANIDMTASLKAQQQQQQLEGLTAEDIIDAVKNKHDDEAYSIEEFTASAAFGIQLNVDHPLAGTRSVTDMTKPSTSSDEILKPKDPPIPASSRLSAGGLGPPVREGTKKAGDGKGPRRWSWAGAKDKKLTDDDTTMTHSDSRLPFVSPPMDDDEDEDDYGNRSAYKVGKSTLSATDQRGEGHATAQPQIGSTAGGMAGGLAKASTRPDVIKPLQPRERVITSVGGVGGSAGGPAEKSIGAYEDGDAIRNEMPRFEREIKKRMFPETYKAGEMIINKHEIGKEMYFLSKGKVEVISGDGRTVYSTINRGSFFGKFIINIVIVRLPYSGELGVLFNVPRTASVRAVVDCYCMVLTRDNLDEVLRFFPHIAERFKSVAEQRMKEVTRKRSYRRRMEVKTIMDVVDGKSCQVPRMH
ncbi:Kinesin-like protein kif27 [Irineochytrium annulatum]|nr:Kinesin-like protein kif27 [Irineochytrium annulatum]